MVSRVRWVSASMRRIVRTVIVLARRRWCRQLIARPGTVGCSSRISGGQSSAFTSASRRSGVSSSAPVSSREMTACDTPASRARSVWFQPFASRSRVIIEIAASAISHLHPRS